MPPRISVVIPTHNRRALLEESLESLAAQDLPAEDFEVVVVNDGSTDDTRELCERLSARIPLRHVYIAPSGISAAKNLGIFCSRAPIVFFFDDDDIADRSLLREHLRAHREHPEENVAILGHTTWAPSLRVSEMMSFVTDVGHFLFSYTSLAAEQVLDFTYFWGGRSSCKRSLLTKHGIFRQQFRFGSEDIELGYRLAKFGLRVVYRPSARQYMNRSLTYEEFCRRCEKQGRSQVEFSRLHPEPEIREYCMVDDAEARWEEARSELGARVDRVRELEARLEAKADLHQRESVRQELWQLYRQTFVAFKLKGIVEARVRYEDHPATPAGLVATF